MSKKNYNKISTEAAKANVESEMVETVEETVATTEPVVEDKIPEIKVFYGVVDNCDRLNVRVQPMKEAPVLEVITKGTEVEMHTTKTSGGFYDIQVQIPGKGKIHGFCMKKYITVKK